MRPSETIKSSCNCNASVLACRVLNPRLGLTQRFQRLPQHGLKRPSCFPSPGPRRAPHPTALGAIPDHRHLVKRKAREHVRGGVIRERLVEAVHDLGTVLVAKLDHAHLAHLELRERFRI